MGLATQTAVKKDGNKKILQQSLPSLLCRSCGNEKYYGKTLSKRAQRYESVRVITTLFEFSIREGQMTYKSIFSKSQGNSPTTTPGTRNEEPE